MRKIFSLLMVSIMTLMLSNVMAEKVYYINSSGWETVKIHAWGGTAAGTTWPGADMTKEDGKILGFDVYSYSAETGAYANCLFHNNNGTQTSDLVWTADKYYYQGEWYAYADLPTDPSEVKYDSIYFVNVPKWAEVRVHLWGGTAAGTEWPGAEMTKEAEQINGYDVYKYVAAKGAYGKCIFNNKGAGEQTADLDWTSGQYFYDKAWYAKADIPAGGEEPVAAETLKAFPKDSTSFIGYAWGEDVAKNITIFDANNYIMMFTQGNALKINANYGLQIGNSSKPSAFVFRLGEEADLTVAIARNGSDMTAKLYYMGETTDTLTAANLATEGTLCASVDITADNAAGVLAKKKAAAGYYKVYGNLRFCCPYIIAAESGDTPEPPTPETKYYAKNNWDGVTDWTWKEMTMKSDDDYQLECVFGGTGVNINTAESDEGAAWYPIEKIEAFDASYEPATLGALDTIVLMYTPSEKMLAALIIGKYTEPVDPNPAKYYIAGTMTEWAKNMVEMAAGEDNSYSVDIALEADSLYMFKVVRVQGTDTAWYGAGMDATMHYGNSTDWSLYGDVDVKLQTTKAADYKFIFVANEAKNISVVIPEPDPYVPVHQNGFYLMGSHNEWAIDDAYLFVRNEQSEVEEYSLNVTLTVGQKIKPAYVENDEAKEWYGANDFEITEAYAGAKTVYFRPVRNGDWGAFGGFIYIADQEGTGLFNTAVEGKAVKTISNGMLIIEKAGVRYNVMGQIIR